MDKKSLEKAPQKMRFNAEEFELIKATFAENDSLLKAIRKVFLQLPISETEKKNIDTAFARKENLQNVVRKIFLPELDGDAPFYQVVDLYMTIELKDKTPIEAAPFIEARIKFIQLVKQQLNILFGGAEEVLKFKDLLPNDNKEISETYSDLMTRNTFIAHVEQQISQLSILAGQKSETAEETRKRLERDSMK